jgi:flagellar motor switch protein FliM
LTLLAPASGARENHGLIAFSGSLEVSRSNPLSVRAGTSGPAVVLDPRTLDRPFHLLDDFNRRLGRQIDRVLDRRFNQRHGASFAVGAVSIVPWLAAQDEALWRGVALPTGSIAVRVARRMLLAMLDCHYGNPGSTPDEATAPETETEQRFGVLMSTALLDVLLDALIMCVEPSPDLALLPKPCAPPQRGQQVIRVEIHEPSLGVADALDFALDDAWLSRLFESAAPARGSAVPAASFMPPDTPLIERIPVTINAQMLSHDLLLDELIHLAPGDILPVRLPATAEVLVEGSPLYRAVIAEQNGTLWLTSFEDAK